MPDPIRPTAVRRRSGVFFESDLRGAAETAAYAMEEHGLAPEQVAALAEAIEDTIRECFRQVDHG